MNQAPAASSLVAQSLPPPTDLAPAETESTVAVHTAPPSPSLKENLLGVEGSWRRELSFLASALVVATAVRVTCFTPLVFGNYLRDNLGPVERESVGWNVILAVRVVDLMMGSWVWKRVDGMTRKDGVLFGALLAGISRVSLYAFEHSYFLLSTETTFTLLLTDIISLAAGFSLLPTLLPHAPPPRPGLTAWKKIQAHPELLVNIALATGLATSLGGLLAYTIEHFGGMEFVKSQVFELEVPAIYAKDTMTASQMMAHPVVSVPTLRSFLTPFHMRNHLLHSFFEAALAVPFVSILPSLSPSQLSLLAFSLIFPASTLLLWDVLPIRILGALGVGATLALRGAITTGVCAWVLEEMRMTFHYEVVEIAVVDEKTDQLVGLVEAVLEVEEVDVNDQRSRL